MKYMITLLALGISSQVQAGPIAKMITNVNERRMERKVERVGGSIEKSSYQSKSIQVPPTVGKVKCTNCTTCGDNCNCVGGGTVCADGRCPITVPNQLPPKVGMVTPNLPRYRTECVNGVCRIVQY